MISNKNSDVIPGWLGGFSESNPAFAYPQPDLTSLPMLDNMDNIDLLQRQQAVKWPEFSWETMKENSDPKRCYQQFAPDISRLGYTVRGEYIRSYVPSKVCALQHSET